jgi:hypothetical protein
MSSYTITITPDDTTHASTTLRVDVSDNAARITELLVRAGAAAGLSPQQLPVVDLDLLLRAVGFAAPSAIPATVVDEATVTAAPARRVRGGRTGARTRRATTKQAEPKAASKRGGAKTGRAAKAATRSTSGGERAYRRAPADLVEVFGKVGGVTAVARHYGVPRYTAQSWIRRLRNEGQLPAR